MKFKYYFYLKTFFTYSKNYKKYILRCNIIGSSLFGIVIYNNN